MYRLMLLDFPALLNIDKVLWVLLYKPWKLWVWLMASMTTLGIH